MTRLPAGRTIAAWRRQALLGAAAWLIPVLAPGAAIRAQGAGDEGIAGNPARVISMQERVSGQREIERILWRHRIWPASNPQPKPALDEVMPAGALRAKAEDSVRMTGALQAIWNHEITASDLADEVRRMAANSRQPDVLREIFDALDDDPALIAECLARPILAERLLRGWYARDERFHGAPREAAERSIERHGTIDGFPMLDGVHSESVHRAGAGPDRAPRPARATREEYEAALGDLRRTMGFTPDDPLLAGSVGKLREDDDSFFILAVLSRAPDEVRVAVVSWPKLSFDLWWANERESHPADGATPAGEYGSVPVIAAPAASCTDDSWILTKADAPDARYGHTAIWTGTDMIVWGGTGASLAPQSSGGRYKPSTDLWTPTGAGLGLPAARQLHTAVWTGSEMIVWGGYDGASRLNTGGRYNPATDSWTATPTGAGAPSPRQSHVAVWTGTEMIVWGGTDNPIASSLLNTGGRFNPSTGAWTATSTAAGTPSARSEPAAAWTGSQMLVWGGLSNTSTGTTLNTGALYSPGADSWTSTSTGANCPSPRVHQTLVWTGTQAIVWGGQADFTQAPMNSGGRYTPSTNTWTATGTGAGVPAGRSFHTAVWTGTQMIVWGGENGNTLRTGGRYNASSDTWSATSVGANVPTAREFHGAVWTNTEMVVWGGDEGPAGSIVGTGSRYNPGSDSWTVTSAGSTVPSGRLGHTAVWSGTEMIVWGGSSSVAALGSGGRYTAATDSWTATATGGSAPGVRYAHTATWSGTEMIVWGGQSSGSTFLNNGARYTPSSNTWATVSPTSAPVARSAHSTVWTGTVMIVWGGFGPADLNSGGRYNPTNNTWVATQTTGAPSARHEHAAVWSGTEMIVWGGSGAGGNVNTGGRYNLGLDSWTALPLGGAPSARSLQTAVWTGTQMIVWGGFNSATSTYQNSGGRYSPSGNSWSATSLGQFVPQARALHTAAWTGTEMIVWGGVSLSSLLSSGARYNPATDAWVPTTGTGAPTGRGSASAVWTGIATQELIVWGGGTYLSSGARYCYNPQCTPTSLWFRDADSDGWGVAAPTQLACTQPAGFASSDTDCNDSNPSIHPGQADVICDNVDENCSGFADEGYVSLDTMCGIGPCASTGNTFCFTGGHVVDTCTPGTPGTEICDGIDNNCDGTTDNVTLPTAVHDATASRISAATARLAWPSVPGATNYDVVRGNLAGLHANGGNFTLSTGACLGNNIAVLTLDDPTGTTPGTGFWYLIRGVNCGGGTYDTGSPSQIGSRDAEIAASASACP